MKQATVRSLRFNWHVRRRMTAVLILCVCLSMDTCFRSLLAFACYFWPSVKRLISSVISHLYEKGKCQHVPFRLKCSKQMSVSRYLHPNYYLLCSLICLIRQNLKCYFIHHMKCIYYLLKLDFVYSLSSANWFFQTSFQWIGSHLNRFWLSNL